MASNSDPFRDLEHNAARQFHKLVKRFGVQKIQSRDDLTQEASRLKRQMLSREAERDTPHDINSAIRTFAPQLAAHKGKAKLNRTMTSRSGLKLGYGR